VPAAAKDTTPISVDEAVIEGRYAELDGYTVGFETHRADADPAPLFQGLPDDRCQCPHFGYVVSGKIVYRYADRDEVFATGDAYHARPGHLPLLHAGTELIEFSPSDKLNETMSVVTRNMQNAEA
jgi:hypothetical protein